MKFIQKIPRWLRNKYLLAFVFFLNWLLFFDHNDVFLQITRSRELNQLKEGKLFYQQQILDTRSELEQIQLTAASLEKLAREKYLMKKDEEQLFLIDEASGGD